MYPFDSLPENLAAFCSQLRREHGFRIGPGELQDAARALALVPLHDERVVRDALRPILCGTRADAAMFDDLFEAFFYPSPRVARVEIGGREDRAGSMQGQRVRSQPRRDDVTAEAGTSSDAPEEGSTSVAAVEGDGDDSAAATLRVLYSPLHGEGRAPDLGPVDQPWRDAALALVRRLRGGQLRRWRPAERGQRFDFRRTLRGSLHTGGEALVPRWQARPRRRPRFVVIVDGSRSMAGHAHAGLQAAVALAGVTRDVEVFTFSTSLRRITRDVRRAASGERRPLADLRQAWGGGTSIGGCLREFLRTSGGRLLGPSVFAVVASDGLDVGNPDVLREAMLELRRRTAAVIWLNPLLDSAGYQPTAAGMRIARPYVTTLASVADAAGLLRLARMAHARR